MSISLQLVNILKALFSNTHTMARLPDGYSQILRSYVFGPSGFWTIALLRYAAKFDPFLSLDCAFTPSTLCPQALHPGAIQGKEGIKFCRLATLVQEKLLTVTLVTVTQYRAIWLQ